TETSTRQEKHGIHWWMRLWRDILRLRSGQALSEVKGLSTFGHLHWSIIIASIAGVARVRLMCCRILRPQIGCLGRTAIRPLRAAYRVRRFNLLNCRSFGRRAAAVRKKHCWAENFDG